MNNLRSHIFAGLALIASGAFAQAQPAATANPVTADNFTRAESDTYFANIVKQAGGVGKFFHRREIEPVDNQIVIRANRDTLYSAGVFDLEAGPVTVALPETGKRFMSLIVIDEDQYVPAVHYGGSHTFSKERIGTRYLMLALRTLVDPSDPNDLRQAHALQDAVTVNQANSGTFEIPTWDPASHKKVKDALLVLASTLPDSDRGFGTKSEVDPVRRLILSASAWGGNPDKEAKYLNVFPKKNDGKTIYRLNVSNVPVDGFWSISVYNAAGNFQKNALDAYSLNNITASKGADGSVAVQFGGCDGKIPNCLPTVPGWNYMVRFYRPRPEILDGSWKFPQPEPVT
jgi:hypothetical protein